LVFSPDGTSVLAAASAGTKNCILIFDARTGEVTQQYPVVAHHEYYPPYFTPDGKRIVVTWRAIAEGEERRVIDLDSGKDLYNAICFAISADGSRAFSGEEIVDTINNNKLGRINAHFDFMGAVFSPDNSHFAAVENDGKVRLWNAQNAEFIGEWMLPMAKGCRPMFSPDSRRLLVHNSEDFDQLHLLDIVTGRWTPIPLSGGRACFSPDSKRVVRFGGGAVNLFDVESGRQVVFGSSALNSFDLSFVFFEDGKRLGIGGIYGYGVYDLATGKPLWQHEEDVNASSFSPKGDTALSVQWDFDAIYFLHRRRPEYWWGVAWLPEFWLTALFAGAFGGIEEWE
jgi:WD40 repeat protein